MLNKQVQADVGSASSKQRQNEGQVRSTMKSMTENVAHTAADVGSRASVTAGAVVSSAISTTTSTADTVIQSGAQMLNQRTPDLYDVGYYGQTDLSADGAMLAAGTSAMLGQNAVKGIKSVEGIAIDHASSVYYRPQHLRNIEQRASRYGHPKQYAGHYHDILLGRSRKDIASLRDRMRLNRTVSNQYANLSYRGRLRVMNDKYRSGAYGRALRRKQLLESRATRYRKQGLHLQRSLQYTVRNQSRKILNSMTSGDDAMTNQTMSVGRRSAATLFRASAFSWRKRRTAYKGAKKIIFGFRHPVMAIRAAIGTIISLLTGLISILVNIPVVVAIVAILLPLIIVILVVVTVISTLFGWLFESRVEVPVAVGISAEVQQYEDDILALLDEYWNEDYLPLVMAVMMQESAGTGCDPMGASLSSFNEEFPREEAGTSCESGITDPQYSIKIGILHLRETMSRADVDGATDLDGIEYALQGYDMGFGWFDETTSPWTQEKAEAYSAMMQEELGVDSFGDPQYPKHVMRYYSYGGRGQLQSMPDFTNMDAWGNDNPYSRAKLYGQCTWFAWGRFYEIYGWAPSWTADGRAWVSNLIAYSPDKFIASSTPRVGAIFSALGKNHVGIVVGWDGTNVIVQEGNLDGVTNTFEDAKTDWQQATYTLEQLQKTYDGVIFANPIDPIEME